MYLCGNTFNKVAYVLFSNTVLTFLKADENWKVRIKFYSEETNNSNVLPSSLRLVFICILARSRTYFCLQVQVAVYAIVCAAYTFSGEYVESCFSCFISACQLLVYVY